MYNPDMSNAISKINSFGELGDNWNGYGAPPFTKSLLDKAKKILRTLRHCPEVFPIAGGAIQFEFENDAGDYLEFEIYDTEPAHCFQITSTESELEFDVGTEKINEVVDKFYG